MGSETTSASATETPFVVDIDGYEGPIDVLLALAHEQKVDLSGISIVELADQYLAFIVEARRADLQLAAEYLVMAAWLAYLKSRLLLPNSSSEDEPTADELAEALAFQLSRLEAMRGAAEKLMARPQLGRDFFSRPQCDVPGAAVEKVVAVTLYDLLKAYGQHIGRQHPQVLQVQPSNVHAVADALVWLAHAVERSKGWENLWNFLPDDTSEELRSGRLRLSERSALAATFAASLELARRQKVQLRQTAPFGPIYLHSLKPKLHRHSQSEKRPPNSESDPV